MPCSSRGGGAASRGGFWERLCYSGPHNGTLTAGTGGTQPGALRLAPANTFRKYGFLINGVKRENFPTGLPRVKISPGEHALSQWHRHGHSSSSKWSGHISLPNHGSPRACCKAAQFETSLSQRALGKIITTRKREISKPNTSNP